MDFLRFKSGRGKNRCSKLQSQSKSIKTKLLGYSIVF